MHQLDHHQNLKSRGVTLKNKSSSKNNEALRVSKKYCAYHHSRPGAGACSSRPAWEIAWA